MSRDQASGKNLNQEEMLRWIRYVTRPGMFTGRVRWRGLTWAKATIVSKPTTCVRCSRDLTAGSKVYLPLRGSLDRPYRDYWCPDRLCSRCAARIVAVGEDG